MTTFDAHGRMTSCFVPPTDEHGQTLSYAAWRARAGIPIGPEEAAAKAEVIRLANEYHATQRPMVQGERWVPNEAFLRLKAAERRVSEIAGPLYRAYEERRRADMGCPISDEEREAEEAYWAIQRSHSWPWTPAELDASLDAHRKWRAAVAASFEFWGVEPEGDALADRPERRGDR